MSSIYVQYGSGFSGPEGWRNFDASPTLRFERLPLVGNLYTRNKQRFPPNVEYGDVCKGLPLATNSCSGVYASHVLEHLALDDFYAAVGETLRILRPGGIFRLVVPDLFKLATIYLDRFRDGDSDASLEFMRATSLGRERRPVGLRGHSRAILGNSEHLWMWDELSLSKVLRDRGFVDVRVALFGDSGDPAFALVEDVSRFEVSCAIQASKPVG
jgi:hypothetical protein